MNHMESTLQTSLHNPAKLPCKSLSLKYICRDSVSCCGRAALPEVGTATYAVITLDVCWACGDNFHGTWNVKDYGAPLIVEKLEANGFKGTFFVSPYCPAHLKNKTLSNVKFLLAHGQDVQLHTHPYVFDPSGKDLSMCSKDEKREILAAGIELLQEAGAPRPIAHRAGQLCIDQETLELLAESGIPIDSSIYAHFADCGAHLPKNVINRFARIGDVYELPIFLIGTLPYIGHTGAMALQLDSTTWWQQKLALE
jgi:peptidoglycan/xylan/chitin deacetylase (PgdA/CDA1 family)